MDERRDTDGEASSTPDDGSENAPTEDGSAVAPERGVAATASDRARGPPDRSAAGDQTADVSDRPRPADDRAPSTPRRSAEPDDAVPSVRSFLAPGESLDRTAPAELLADSVGQPATVALTDRRALVVTADGSFTGVEHDRIATVRGRPRSRVWVRGADHRLPLVAGALLTLAGFLGVLGTAISPLTPALALLTLGGVLAVETAVTSADPFEGTPIPHAVRRADGVDELIDLVGRIVRAVDARGSEDRLLLIGGAAVAVASPVAILVLGGSALALFFAVVTVAGVLTVRYVVRHGDEFDGLELVRRHYRLVRLSLDGGGELRLRTDAEARLDRDIAALAQATGPAARRDGGSPSRAESEAG